MEKHTEQLKLLTVDETVEILRCGKTSVNSLLWSGALPSIKAGRWRLVRQIDLEQFLAVHECRPGEET
jgi:excisionase family DNA binding protein